jgi:hypothetical protein
MLPREKHLININTFHFAHQFHRFKYINEKLISQIPNVRGTPY